MGKDFHSYVNAWRQAFPAGRELAWQENWLVNGYCCDCRYCCGPQDNDSPFPMALLPSQMRPDLAKDFYLLDEQTAYMDSRGCKALGSQGCSLAKEQRPVACGLFPLVLANGGLWLYKICPASILVPLAEWLTLAAKARNWLRTLSEAHLRHISITLDAATLTDRYVNLNMTLFTEPDTKENI